MIEFRMPSMGADMEAGTLREWKVKPGDVVKRGDIIAEVEAQKGIIEIECFEAGVIEKLLIQVDQKVPVGTPMALIRPPGEGPATPLPTERPEISETAIPVTAEPAPAPEPTVAPRQQPPEHMEQVSTPTPEEPRTDWHLPERGPRISPLARRMAEANQIDPVTVHGTGEDGAITRADIEKAIEAKKVTNDISTTPTTNAGDTIRQAVAAAMSRSNREIPHYYVESRIDMQASLDWLSRHNAEKPVKERLLPAALLLKAAARALRTVPELNAVWDNGLVRKEAIHMGFVLSLRGGGIIVPAIHDTDRKSVGEIMAALNDVIPRARALRLRSSELSDSTVTLTSLGEGGAEKVFGIIYPPQVAVIGIGAIHDEALVIKGEICVRPVLCVTLGGDHRATDGLSGSRFLSAMGQYLQQPQDL